MVPARWALRLAAACALLVRSPVANAMSCAPFPPFELFPAPLLPAPTNTHVWVSVNSTAWKSPGGCPADDAPCTAPDLDFELRSAPVADKERHTVAVDTLHSRLPERDVYELIPRERLRPDSRYDVIASSSGHVQFAGTVRIGKTADTTAPSWSGPLRAWRPPYPPLPTKRNGHPLGVLDPYAGGAPLYLSATAATDATPVRYEVWRADKDGSIDYRAPPSGFGLLMEARLFAEPARAPQLGFGDFGCRGWSFDSSDEGPLRLGFVAVDLAGNRSAPRVLDVEAR